ncbi:MAG: DUF4157 domain-containing protein, partial [Terriglobales bacterium]
MLQRKCPCGGSPGLAGECEGCRKKKLLQRRAVGPAEPAEVPPIVHEVLRSPGQPLDPAARAFFEPRFGHDFSRVRVHTDARAADSARAVNALAYTVGPRVVFDSGMYAPSTSQGQCLLAHELTHVVQQDSISADGIGRRLGAMHSAESEAERSSKEIRTRDKIAPAREHTTAGQLARQKKPEAGSGPAHPRRRQFDILGADMSVADVIVRSAVQALGTDMRVSSLEDMISQLEAVAGPKTTDCVEQLSIWNHGSPAGQALVGTETIRTRDGRAIRFPYSGLTLGWLLSQGNQAALERLRNVFCCGATMRWLGCGTAGVEAAGGARTETETRESQQRYGQYGD